MVEDKEEKLCARHVGSWNITEKEDFFSCWKFVEHSSNLYEKIETNLLN